MFLPALSLAFAAIAIGEAEFDAGGIHACGELHEKKEQESSEGHAEWCETRDLYGRWVKDGPYLSFSADGTLRLAGTFRDGKRSGLWRSFDAAGHSTRVEEYAADGQRQSTNLAPTTAGPAAGPPPPAHATPAAPAPTAAAPGAAPAAPAGPVSSTAAAAAAKEEDDFDPTDEIHHPGDWNAGRVGAQMGFGLLATGVAVALGGGAGLLAGNAVCDGPPVKSFQSSPNQCQTYFIGGGALLAYLPLSALGVWLGGKITKGRGDYLWTLLGSAVNVLLAFWPTVGYVLVPLSSGQIILYHESEQPPGKFLSQGGPSLFRLDATGFAIGVPSLSLRRTGPEPRALGVGMPLLSIGF
jgi:hypothetical protein